MKIIVMRCKYNLYEEEKNSLEAIAKRIYKDPKLKTAFTAFMGLCMYTQSVLASPNTTNAANKINSAGMTIYALAKVLGRWACVILCAFEIIKALGNGDTKALGKIVWKYIIAFAALWGVPWVFDLIEGLFS